ncbi:hypothetical protein AMATHDRAFT_61788 [Amanita thiersii Skay4041]|uniref:Brix domain-containing protein n=1 Tax=Amanita thiersii Skay4041 TaxID=703135 RepID=A0A2A9NP59_9AGAR|nr:hypothetical protein AMATHDRAFT_61788 [Amanita thiersii Skay4041]
MARRRRKNRTHLKGGEEATPGKADNTPKSFVIKHGQVGSSVAQLVRDLRKVMEPNTASRLRERQRNKLKDYLTMAPALQVTHLLAFTVTDVAPSMRIIRLSNGPTLSFRIERYSLMKDVLNMSKRTRSIGMEYLTPPLVVLASFPPPSPTTPPHIPLLMKSFQSLFPPLSPHTITLSSARRVVLVSYNPDRGTVDLRHYIITVKAFGVSRRIRRILEGQPTTASAATSSVIDLGNEKDVADFVLRRRGEMDPGDGYESAVSSAGSVAGDEENAVDLADDYVGRNNRKGQRRAVRLDEVGPRMELRLIKIVEGVPGKEGNVIYHEFVKKTKKEAAAQKAEHDAKEKLRKERREEQERNVARKMALSEVKRQGPAVPSEKTESEDEIGEDDGEWDEDEEISEGEESEENSEDSEGSSDDIQRPVKKARLKGKR